MRRSCNRVTDRNREPAIESTIVGPHLPLLEKTVRSSPGTRELLGAILFAPRSNAADSSVQINNTRFDVISDLIGFPTHLSLQIVPPIPRSAAYKINSVVTVAAVTNTMIYESKHWSSFGRQPETFRIVSRDSREEIRWNSFITRGECKSERHESRLSLDALRYVWKKKLHGIILRECRRTCHRDALFRSEDRFVSSETRGWICRGLAVSCSNVLRRSPPDKAAGVKGSVIHFDYARSRLHLVEDRRWQSGAWGSCKTSCLSPSPSLSLIHLGGFPRLGLHWNRRI